MQVLGLTLKELADKFRMEYGRGLYHASALYREVFKSGNPRFFEAGEFLASPAFAREVKRRMAVSPGRLISKAKEGHLTKFVTRLSDGRKIESVIIPMKNYHTLCVSCQVGCKMGCRFCETAKMGFYRHLDAYEIIGQLYTARFVLKKKIKNVVFMGMGEPFDNFEQVIRAIRIMNEQRGFDIALRHITVSTAGLVSGINRLASLGLRGLRLAVSINAANDPTRSFLMPVNRRVPLLKLKQALSAFPLTKRGGFLFEYILIKGLNDSEKDAINLADYIKPLPVRLNLIPYNPVKGFNYLPPSDEEMNSFAGILAAAGVFVVKRWSKGRSVSAGCGQLGRQCLP